MKAETNLWPPRTVSCPSARTFGPKSPNSTLGRSGWFRCDEPLAQLAGLALVGWWPLTSYGKHRPFPPDTGTDEQTEKDDRTNR